MKAIGSVLAFVIGACSAAWAIDQPAAATAAHESDSKTSTREEAAPPPTPAVDSPAGRSVAQPSASTPATTEASSLVPGNRAATPAARPATDGRVSFGEFSISRPRFEMSNGAVHLSDSGAPGSQKTPTAGMVTGAIPVPANTLGPADPDGESLHVRKDREAVQRRIQESFAEEAQARADLARLDAAYYERNLRRGVVVNGYGAYAGYIRRPYGAHAIGSGAAGAAPGDPVTVSRQRFAGSQAYFNFAQAARPPIGDIQRAQLNAQREFSRAASRDDIIPIQRRIDDAVRGNRLDLVPVDENEK